MRRPAFQDELELHIRKATAQELEDLEKRVARELSFRKIEDKLKAAEAQP